MYNHINFERRQFMKKLLILSAICSVLLLSCATTNTSTSTTTTATAPASSLTYSIPKGTEFELADGITAKITSYKPVNNVIIYQGKSYTPSGAGNTAFKATLSITNNTQTGVRAIPFNKLELCVANSKAELSFSNYTKPTGTINGMSIDALLNTSQKDQLPAGATVTETIYFVYPKANTPVAITQNRVPVFTMYTEKTPNASLIDANLVKYPHITECFQMTKKASVEEIENYMNQYGITYQDKDMNGLPLIVHAIANRNNAVFDKALESDSDLSILVRLNNGSDSLDLLGIAALQCNKYACDKLMAKGFTIDSKPAAFGEKQNPVVVAVRNNDMMALRFIVEVLKVDVSELKIPMAWSGAMDAEKFCRDRNRPEMADYLARHKK